MHQNDIMFFSAQSKRSSITETGKVLLLSPYFEMISSASVILLPSAIS